MTGDSDPDATDEPEPSIWSRTTAPQSPYSTGDVTKGILVLIIGLLIIAGIPLLLT
jgi:hypothetical protein